VTIEWLAAALVFAFANFVLGLVGFGNGLVAMALLPLLMSPVTALAVLTMYTIVLSTAVFVPIRRHLLVGPSSRCCLVRCSVCRSASGS
jgi:uncharacterized membrane protein YfcA